MKRWLIIGCTLCMAALCTSCVKSILDIIDSELNSMEEKRKPEDQYWTRAYRVIDNQTSRPLRVVYGFFDYGPTLPDGGEMCDFGVAAGEKVITNCCSAFRDVDVVSVRNFDLYPSDKSRAQKIVIYDENRTEVVYEITYEMLKDGSLWRSDSELNAKKLIVDDYLEWYMIEEIERGRIDQYTFIYWTLTLTDEMLAKWAAGE